MAFFYPTFRYSFPVLIYRTYADGEYSMAYFIAFVYFCNVFAVHCQQELEDLSPMDTSGKKFFLKSLLCVLWSAAFFGFSYQMYSHGHDESVAAVLVFVVFVFVSYFLYLLYFVHDGRFPPPPPETPRARKVRRAAV